MDGYDEYEDLRPSKHAGVKRLSDEITCEICEGVLRDPATLPCCHTFCLACVEDKLQGHGVYESKCPRCGMPLHFKDLRVNQSYNGVIEQIESARARFSVLERENARNGTRRDPPRPDSFPREPRRWERESRPFRARRGAARLPATCATSTPRWRSRGRLEKRPATPPPTRRRRPAPPRRARREQSEKVSSEKGVAARDASPSETLPSPTPIYVSYRDTQNTDPNATGPETLNRSLATPARRLRPVADAKSRRLGLDSTRLAGRGDLAGCELCLRDVAGAVADGAAGAASVRGGAREASAEAPGARAQAARRAGEAGRGPGGAAHRNRAARRERRGVSGGGGFLSARTARRGIECGTERRETRLGTGAATGTGTGTGSGTYEKSPKKISRVFACSSRRAVRVFAGGESLGGVRRTQSRGARRGFGARDERDSRRGFGGNRTRDRRGPAEGLPPARAKAHLLVDTRDDADGTTPTMTNSKTKTKTRVRYRTVKYLEAVARGAWVLPFSYLDRCAAARRWLPERDFELEDAGRGVRAEDGSWTVPGPDGDEKPGEASERFAVFGVGPAGRPRASLRARPARSPARWSRWRPRRRACWSRRWSDCCSRAARRRCSRACRARARAVSRCRRRRRRRV